MRLRLKFQRSVSIIREEVSDAEDENEDLEESDDSPQEVVEEPNVENQQEESKEKTQNNFDAHENSKEEPSFIIIDT